MSRRIEIGDDVISDDSPCYVIAEVGHNHQGSLETAKELFRQAKECGANAVKLQKRDNRTLYTKEMYNSPYVNRNSYGSTYGEHREALEFGLDEYLELKAFCAEIGVTFLSTAFDLPSVDFLEKVDLPAYKVASGDLKSTPLLEYVADTGKPMIVSTGGGTMEDVQRAYDAIMSINPQLAILQCTSDYPAEYDELNLGVIQTYRGAFPECIIGYSGHDNSIAMPLVAYILGARIIEKHFTLNRAMKGTDHAFSLEPQGLRKLVRDITRARVAIGSGIKEPFDSEASAIIKMGKKIVAKRDLAVGHALGVDDLTLKSPGDGIPPYKLPDVIGLVLKESVSADTPIHWDILEDENGVDGMRIAEQRAVGKTTEDDGSGDTVRTH